MKITIIPAIVFLLAFTNSDAQEYPADKGRRILHEVIALAQKEKLDLTQWSGETRERLWVLLSLYELGTSDSIAEANGTLSQLLDSPVTPSKIAGEALFYSMFTSTAYVMMIDHYASKMSPELRLKAKLRLKEIVEYIAQAWEPEHLTDEALGHTNYALMWAHAYLRGSEILGDEENLTKARQAFHDWCDYTLYQGLTEFNATTYYKIDIWALGELAERSVDPEVRRRARAFADLFWLDLSIHYWPAQERTMGAMARTYSLTGVGGTRNTLYSHLLERDIAVTLGDEVLNVVTVYRPPAWFREIALEKRPLIFQGRWQAATADLSRKDWAHGGGDGAYGCRFGCDRYTYVEPRYALGTGGDGYAWQDRMLAADFSSQNKKLAPIGNQINTRLPLHSEKPFMDFVGKMRHWPFRSALVQKKNVAMMLCTLNVPERARCPIVAPLLLFPANVDVINVNREMAARSPGLHALSPEDVLFLEDGDVYAALRFIPTGEGFHGYKPTYWYRVDGSAEGSQFGALITSLYDGPSQRPIGKDVRTGFLVEMGSRDQFPSLRDFQTHILEQTHITQAFEKGIWDVTFAAPGTVLRLKRDVGGQRTLEKTVDGVAVSPSIFESGISSFRDGIITITWKDHRHLIDLNRRDVLDKSIPLR